MTQTLPVRKGLAARIVKGKTLKELSATAFLKRRRALRRAAASLIVAAIAACIGGSRGWAQSAPPAARWSGDIEAGSAHLGGGCCEAATPVPVTGPGSFSNSITSPYGATASTTVVTTGTPFPSLSVSSQTSAFSSPDYVTTSSQIELYYYVQFDGPGASVNVDLHGAAALSASGDTSTSATVELYAGSTLVAGVNFNPTGVTGCCYGIGVQPDFNPASFTIQAAFMNVPTGSPIEITMVAAADAEPATNPDGPQSASAYLDPYFSIDPSTPDADQYSILTSPGIGNAMPSAVPEPSTWVMMVLGFAGLAWAGWRGGRVVRTVRSA